jgi:hypothetical protein
MAGHASRPPKCEFHATGSEWKHKLHKIMLTKEMCLWPRSNIVERFDILPVGIRDSRPDFPTLTFRRSSPELPTCELSDAP